MSMRKCDMGTSAREPSMIGSTSLNITPDQDKQLLIKVGSISKVTQTLVEYFCSEQSPSAKDSYYAVSYQEFGSGTPEKDLDFQKSRMIGTQADCEVMGVTDKTECIAYQILSKTAGLTLDQLPAYNFYITIPAWQASFVNIKIKFKGFSVSFDQWHRSFSLDYSFTYVEKEQNKNSTTVQETKATTVTSPKYEDLLFNQDDNQTKLENESHDAERKIQEQQETENQKELQNTGIPNDLT